jgi:hypothetical protein
MGYLETPATCQSLGLSAASVRILDYPRLASSKAGFGLST